MFQRHDEDGGGFSCAGRRHLHCEQAMQRRVREESEHNHPVKRARVAGEIGAQSLKVSVRKRKKGRHMRITLL